MGAFLWVLVAVAIIIISAWIFLFRGSADDRLQRQRWLDKKSRKR